MIWTSHRSRHRSWSSPQPPVHLAPPAIDSAKDMVQTTKEQRDARKRTEAIDLFLKDDGIKRRRDIDQESRILLLGQAEAGKTTILKQMRILYDAQAHQKERDTWRLIIQLNTLTSVRILVEAYEATLAQDAQRSTPTRSLTIEAALGSPTTSTHGLPPSALSRSSMASKHPELLVRLRLAPLLRFEDELRNELGALGQHTAPKTKDQSPSTVPAWIAGDQRDAGKLNATATKINDVFLPAGWSTKLNRSFSADKVLHASDQASTAASIASRRSLTSRLRRACSHLGHLDGHNKSKAAAAAAAAASKSTASAEFAAPTTPSMPLAAKIDQLMIATKDDVQTLWQAPFARRLRLQQSHPSLTAVGATDSTVYFLNNFDRIAKSDYQPSDQDILHARVRTVGVTEEVFTVEKGARVRFFDVGGSVSQRFVWPSYISDFGIRAILFLVPLSAFDEQLAEDSRRNRLLDSLELFEEVVQNPLLKDVTLVLFLNKMDLLEAKLKSGIQVRDHFPAYRGKNEYEHVWRWFRKRFRAIHDSVGVASQTQTQTQTQRQTQHTLQVDGSSTLLPAEPSTSGRPRSAGGAGAPLVRQRYLYVHTTVAVSTKHIRAILCDVNDALLREHLNAAGLC